VTHRAANARPEVLALLADAREHPEEDAPRLVLADWLEENGDDSDRTRAEFIRLQCRCARLPATDPRYAEMMWRAAELPREHAWAWLAPLALDSWRWREFSRGLLRLCVDSRWFLEQKPTLAEGEAWAWVAELMIQGSGGDDLVRSPLLAGLTALTLFDTRLSPAGARLLADATRLSGLTRLVLDYNKIGDEGAAALAASPNFPQLRELSLDHNGIGEVGALALAHSPHLDRLTRLSLASNHISTEGRLALQERFGQRLTL
jgi:uncharacterized protein (TIGR02996 family)